jgi:hypothetical protein
MSDIIPFDWEMPGAGSGIEFDENGTMFSQQYVDSMLMPKTCVWTLKRDENKNVSLFFEDPTNKSWNDEHFSRWTKESNTSRFVPSKPTMITHVVSVFSWKFLPNNLDLGSIVFYGFAQGNKFQIYCGDKIKNTKTNPSTQVWDILNDSDLPQGLQVGIDMFSAIELKEAENNKTKASSTLRDFALKFSDKFENWMTPHLSELSNAVEETTSILEVSKKYSDLDGKTFLISPGEEWEVLDSYCDVSLNAYNGKDANLKLEDNVDNRKTECFRDHPEFEKPIFITSTPPENQPRANRRNPFLSNSPSLGEPYLKNGDIQTDL